MAPAAGAPREPRRASRAGPAGRAGRRLGVPAALVSGLLLPMAWHFAHGVPAARRALDGPLGSVRVAGTVRAREAAALPAPARPRGGGGAPGVGGGGAPRAPCALRPVEGGGPAAAPARPRRVLPEPSRAGG